MLRGFGFKIKIMFNVFLSRFLIFIDISTILREVNFLFG